MRQDELLALVAAVVVLLVLVGGGAAVILSRKKVDGKPETPLQPLVRSLFLRTAFCFGQADVFCCL